jgi:hypothetical protein
MREVWLLIWKGNPVMNHLALTAAAVTLFSSTVFADSSLRVTHGPLDAPTYVDAAAPGDSPGDMRIWRFSATTSTNQPVMMDWVMITTGRDAASKNLESRMTSSVVTIGANGEDTILLQGAGLYPVAGAALKRDVPLDRAVIGGTGRYAGAMGVVTTTHLSDGSWEHVFQIK